MTTLKSARILFLGREIQTRIFCRFAKLVQSIAAFAVSTFLILQQILKVDASMSSDVMKWDLVAFDEVDEKLTRHSQEISSSLRRESLVLGDHHDCLPLAQLLQKTHKMVINRFRYLCSVPIAIYKTDMAGRRKGGNE